MLLLYMWIYLLDKIEIYLHYNWWHDTWVYRTIKQEFIINEELEQSTTKNKQFYSYIIIRINFILVAIKVTILNLLKLSMMPTQYHSEHLTLLTESSKKKLQTIHNLIYVSHCQNEPHLGGNLGGHLKFLKTLNDVSSIKSSNSAMSSNQ